MKAVNELLSTYEVSEILHVTPATIRTWIRKGMIRGHRLPGNRVTYRIARTDLVAFVKSMSQGGTP